MLLSRDSREAERRIFKALFRLPDEGRHVVNANAIDQTSNHPGAGIQRLSEELNREDSELRSHLLDAAIAGLRLARNPDSAALKHDVAQIWEVMGPVLAHHLEAEDSQLLPWLDRSRRVSAETVQKIRQSHDRLRALIGTISKTDPARLTAAQAREVGQALVTLTMTLDDAIDDEERRLLPALRKALFAITHHS